MSIVRGTLRDDTLRTADAFGSGRWDRAPGGEVDRRISGVFDRIWYRILNANKQYRVADRTPTSDVSGRYLVSDLTQGLGDAAQRFYRILAVLVDGRQYQGPVDLTTWTAAAQATTAGDAGPAIWYQEGLNLNLLPQQAGKTADIWVNWIPARPSVLSDDNAIVDFPDGHEDVLITLAAARLLMKGGAETQASLELKADITEDYEELLQDVARIATKPLTMNFTDSASDWAG